MFHILLQERIEDDFQYTSTNEVYEDIRYAQARVYDLNRYAADADEYYFVMDADKVNQYIKD